MIGSNCNLNVKNFHIVKSIKMHWIILRQSYIYSTIIFMNEWGKKILHIPFRECYHNTESKIKTSASDEDTDCS